MYFDKIFKEGQQIAHSFHDIYQALNKPIVVGTGLSGSLAIAILHQYYKFPFIIIRKDSDKSHGSKYECHDVVFAANDNHYLIVDDQICSGDTVDRIIKDMKEFYTELFPCGAFLYQYC